MTPSRNREVESIINRYYDPATDQFLSIDPNLAATDQPYVFTNDDPLNAEDPLGDCGWCSTFINYLAYGLASATVDVGTAIIPGADETGAGEAWDTEADSWLYDETVGDDSEPAQTDHGETRSNDPTRLDKTQQNDVMKNPTETYTQEDGAKVYVQEAGGKFNVVIKNEETGKIITNLKTISQSKLAKLLAKYGSK